MHQFESVDPKSLNLALTLYVKVVKKKTYARAYGCLFLGLFESTYGLLAATLFW